ncbi:hypothetical protein Xen7305DRAFT_00003870 [Xenococcus sp. PCC 7305]|uniref:Spy/CpxP family protein refolding chaperone n=1 Tax=Xenococcus sp. PCC 7305 TaxID=102125 RepID=UPI0002ACE197|nr:Spy/CpxP family protein refolding chaperone [Xenococcus sp. PCC 7305]ELS00686.1 hypothetical protein Xen7305DRAFT_00003870 [Xenococcus sp. PCC 7305]
MKKLALLSSLFLGLAFTSVANFVSAEPKQNIDVQLLAQSTETPKSAEEAVKEFIDSLNLTDEQKTQIKTIVTDYRPEIIETFQELVVALNTLEQVVKPESSSNEIRVARDEVVHLERKLSDIMFDELIAIRDELTVEQRGQINQKIRELASKKASQ